MQSPYRAPSVRLKDRFEKARDIEEPTITGATSANKVKQLIYYYFNEHNMIALLLLNFQYDYLIVFPVTEGQHADKSISASIDRVEWATASKIWKSAVFGTDDMKLSAANDLAEHWKT